MSTWIFYNDKLLPANEPVLEAGNRIFQYGDGLFETMRICNGEIVLREFHFDRLFAGMQALMLEASAFNRNYLRNAVLDLCKANEQIHARVRLSVFRKQQVNDKPGILIESWPLEEQYSFKTDPFSIDVYPHNTKSIGTASAFKTIAYMPYALAGVFARQHELNDCIVLNSKGQACDSSIANVFFIKNNIVHTPPLTEGCVQGVMRRHIITNIDQPGFHLEEIPVTVEMLGNADEIFLTNVIRGIQPVTSFAGKELATNLSRNIFNILVKPLTEA